MKRVIAVAVLLQSLCIGLANAGTSGIVSGRIIDQQGMPVAGMRVWLVSASDRCETRSDARGFFSCMTLAPDVYTLSADANGYQPMSIAGFPVMADTTLYQPLTARPAIKCQCRVISKQGSIALGMTAPQDVYLVRPWIFPVNAGRVSVGDLLRFVPGVTVP